MLAVVERIVPRSFQIIVINFNLIMGGRLSSFYIAIFRTIPDVYCHCLDGSTKNMIGVRRTHNNKDFNISQVFLNRIALATYLVNPLFRELFLSFLAL